MNQTLGSMFLRSLRIVGFVLLSPMLSPFLLIAALCWICYWLTSVRVREESSTIDGVYYDFNGLAGYAYGI